MKPNKTAQKRLDYRRQITFWYVVLLLTAFLFSFDASGIARGFFFTKRGGLAFARPPLVHIS